MEAVKNFLVDLLTKLRSVVLSRKFWALLTALVAIGDQLSAGTITEWQALMAAVAALGVYIGATAYEDGQRAHNTKPAG